MISTFQQTERALLGLLPLHKTCTVVNRFPSSPPIYTTTASINEICCTLQKFSPIKYNILSIHTVFGHLLALYTQIAVLTTPSTAVIDRRPNNNIHTRRNSHDSHVVSCENHLCVVCMKLQTMMLLCTFISGIVQVVQDF